MKEFDSQSASAMLPLNQVIQGDCIEVLQNLPDNSIDVIFADPPYNLQLSHPLLRPNLSPVDGVDDDWDQFQDLSNYDTFTQNWLTECRRILKTTGTLWVIGSYHNIFRVGAILQNLGFWILNDIIWIKTNPMPNFRGVRFTNAHETLIWAQKEKGARYVFNHYAMKSLNDNLQMRSDWLLPTCKGRKRLKVNGLKAHSTQKPEALLFRVITASSMPGDVILDPFFGTGTTGAVAKKLRRNWIGIERNEIYARLSQQRIQEIPESECGPEVFQSPNPRQEKRIPFGRLLESGLLNPGQILYYGKNGDIIARIMADGSLEFQGQRGSIHQIARLIQPGPRNGWVSWHYLDPVTQQREPIDRLRQIFRDYPNQEKSK